MTFKKISIEIGLPYIGKISGDWEPDQKERQAAWELYVELITRVSVINLGPDEGLLRESLSSLYSLFSTTREILRKYGPAVAKPKDEDGISFGLLSVAVLNTVLRPILSKWHPLLEDYEARKPSEVSPLEYERKWEKAAELRGALEGAAESRCRPPIVQRYTSGSSSSLILSFPGPKIRPDDAIQSRID